MSRRLANALLLVGQVAAGMVTDLLQTVGDSEMAGARALFGLMAGAALYRLRLARGNPSGPTSVYALAAFAAAVGIMAVAGSLPVLALLFHPIAAAAIWLGADSETFLSKPPFDLLGRMSYSIYLIHFPCFSARRCFSAK